MFNGTLEVGKKLRVRNDLQVGVRYGSNYFISPMESQLGKIVTVSNWSDEGILLSESDYVWTREMFEETLFLAGDKIKLPRTKLGSSISSVISTTRDLDGFSNMYRKAQIANQDYMFVTGYYSNDYVTVANTMEEDGGDFFYESDLELYEELAPTLEETPRLPPRPTMVWKTVRGTLRVGCRIKDAYGKTHTFRILTNMTENHEVYISRIGYPVTTISGVDNDGWFVEYTISTHTTRNGTMQVTFYRCLSPENYAIERQYIDRENEESSASTHTNEPIIDVNTPRRLQLSDLSTGLKVRVREDLTTEIACVVLGMLEFRGQVITLTRINRDFTGYYCEENDFFWTPEMLSEIVSAEQDVTDAEEHTIHTEEEFNVFNEVAYTSIWSILERGIV